MLNAECVFIVARLPIDTPVLPLFPCTLTYKYFISSRGPINSKSRSTELASCFFFVLLRVAFHRGQPSPGPTYVPARQDENDLKGRKRAEEKTK